jgi:hypothetical protein
VNWSHEFILGDDQNREGLQRLASFGRQLSHNPAKANCSLPLSAIVNGRFDLASKRIHS